MTEKRLTIDELLNSLKSPKIGTLENTKETWARIANRHSTNDKFGELNMDESTLEAYLKEFCENNPYNNLKK